MSTNQKITQSTNTATNNPNPSLGKPQTQPVESISFSNDFAKRSDAAQMDKKGLKFDFERPPVRKVYAVSKGTGLSQLPPETKKDSTQVETISFSNTFAKKHEPQMINKKDLQFDFEAPPKHRVNVKGSENPLFNDNKPLQQVGNQTGETIEFASSFNKRVDPAKIDKKDLVFDFERPSQHGRVVKSAVSQLPQVNSQPIEKLEYSGNFTKRIDLSQTDKSKLRFDFDKPPVKINHQNNQEKSNLNQNTSSNNKETNITQTSTTFRPTTNNIKTQQSRPVIAQNLESSLSKQQNPQSQINRAYNSAINNSSYSGISKASDSNALGSVNNPRQITVTSKNNVSGGIRDIELALNKKFGDLKIREEKQNFRVYRLSDRHNEKNDGKKENVGAYKDLKGNSNGYSEREVRVIKS